jgi:Glycosyl hydrolase family 63 C-terminal domain
MSRASERFTPERANDPESVRLEEDALRTKNWKRWGPYLAERQWGTVREDYSADGSCWTYFPHDHARSRAYRWGEDGLLGICDREGRLCFALAFWNGRDPILKERLFGLTNPEGNHGEDVKEQYFYLDSTPTHSYMKALYKYPQAEFPYERLVEENRRRGVEEGEFEILDTGVFDGGYFDVFAEYAKASPEDILVQITVANRGPAEARIEVLPTLWFRNTWSWGRTGEGYWPKPMLARQGADAIRAEHVALGRYRLVAGPGPGGAPPALVFTENETNAARLFGSPNASPWVKDAFHELVVGGRADAVNPEGGTKAAARYRLLVPGGGEAVLRLRLHAQDETQGDEPLGAAFDAVLAARRGEADAFYAARIPAGSGEEETRVVRQALGGLLWSRQFYNYVVRDWLQGDPAQPPPPAERLHGRNAEWVHIYNRDVLSVPDKWEYPWYAAWDLAFHMIPMAAVDPHFAKQQLILFLREWYMHASGQLAAYEFSFSDVNPPVHAWACWRVYKMTGPRGGRDREFLARAFHKLLINFTWWVNRKDRAGNNLFTGGFLGLDNIGVFDRSRPLPTGGELEQADATAWMAFFCSTMLSMALELAREEPAYEDVASKFFEHFVAIADAMNTLGGTGLWDEADGFYYDQLSLDGSRFPLRVRSLVGAVPLFAGEVLERSMLDRLPGFRHRLEWFLRNRADLCDCISHAEMSTRKAHGHLLMAIPTRQRLERVVRTLLDEEEFLSPWGIRSMSKIHERHPYVLDSGDAEHRVAYAPGEADSRLFGGNSNWRGPVWLPMNYLIVEALERYHRYYRDELKVECPTGSGRWMSLKGAAHEISVRVARLFLPDAAGRRPCLGPDPRWVADPHWRDLVLFHEYFHAETGRGLGASHQTGWTSLAARFVMERQ